MRDFADSSSDRGSAVTWSDSIAAVPAGAWAVGVSGGADSVALLAMVRTRPDLRLHVAHLDHQTRGHESAADASFVSDLSKRWQLPFHMSLRSDVESDMKDLPPNRSARFRAVRMAFFRRVVDENHLAGVLLAHHADDVAETVLHRLLRGSSARGLAGIAWRCSHSRIDGSASADEAESQRPANLFEEHWPVLAARMPAIRATRISAIDCENCCRQKLQLAGELIALSEASRKLREWIVEHQVPLEDVFAASRLQSLPMSAPVEAARRWLLWWSLAKRPYFSRNRSPDHMAMDLASPPRIQFPGNIAVRRQRGKIFVPTAPQ